MFKLIKIDNARMNVPEPEYFVCGETITTSRPIKCGYALRLSDGKLYLASEEYPVRYIAMADGIAGETIPVCRVTQEQLWETRVDSEEMWYNIKVGDTIDVDNSIIQSGRDSNHAHAIVEWIGETDFYVGGNPNGGPVRVRFLCNYGRDANSTSKL